MTFVCVVADTCTIFTYEKKGCCKVWTTLEHSPYKITATLKTWHCSYNAVSSAKGSSSPLSFPLCPVSRAIAPVWIYTNWPSSQRFCTSICVVQPPYCVWHEEKLWLQNDYTVAIECKALALVVRQPREVHFAYPGNTVKTQHTGGSIHWSIHVRAYKQ